VRVKPPALDLEKDYMTVTRFRVMPAPADPQLPQTAMPTSMAGGGRDLQSCRQMFWSKRNRRGAIRFSLPQCCDSEFFSIRDQII
jgi:hypothetical protein